MSWEELSAQMIAQHPRQTVGVGIQQRNPELVQPGIGVRSTSTKAQPQSSSPQPNPFEPTTPHRPARLDLKITSVFSSREKRIDAGASDGRGSRTKTSTPGHVGLLRADGFLCAESTPERVIEAGSVRRRGSMSPSSNIGFSSLFASSPSCKQTKIPPSPPPKSASFKSAGILQSALGLELGIGAVGRGSTVMLNSP
jgi:hypothetical protein